MTLDQSNYEIGCLVLNNIGRILVKGAGNSWSMLEFMCIFTKSEMMKFGLLTALLPSRLLAPPGWLSWRHAWKQLYTCTSCALKLKYSKPRNMEYKRMLKGQPDSLPYFWAWKAVQYPHKPMKWHLGHICDGFVKKTGSLVIFWGFDICDVTLSDLCGSWWPLIESLSPEMESASPKTPKTTI